MSTNSATSSTRGVCGDHGYVGLYLGIQPSALPKEKMKTPT